MMTAVDFGRYKRIVEYFWDPEPTNAEGSKLPIWCLGCQYPLNTIHDTLQNVQTPPDENAMVNMDIRGPAQAATPPRSLSSSMESEEGFEQISEIDTGGGGWPKAFLDDFEARMWFCYRSNFPNIPRLQEPRTSSTMSFLRNQLGDQSGFTSDTGWGCMIRSGQSLLANAISFLYLGRAWRRGTSVDQESKILSMFADDPRAPYSIHKFVEYGAEACGKRPGEWFGPSATARCIQELANRHDSSNFGVYITGDGSDVYEDTFMNIAKPDGITFKPTLILVGTLLGIGKINPAYWEALSSSLQMPQSIGIAGGRPSSSHYFVGTQGPYFFYLDPHQTRPALPFQTIVYTATEMDSCHTRRLRRIHVKEMDPSMLIGFLIRDEDDWHRWREGVQSVQGKAVIHVADKNPALLGLGGQRSSAIDDVESFDEDDGDDDTIILDEYPV